MISVTIVAKNCERHIYDCLKAVEKFDEVIVLDNGSNDRTLEIASKFSNVKIHKHEFIGFGALKNLAAKYAKNNWILNLDGDEVLSPLLAQEILSLKLHNNQIYKMPYENHYGKRLIQGCGWKDRKAKRLYNKNFTSFNEHQIHEGIIEKPNCAIINLNHSVKHYPCLNIGELIQKMQLYSTLFAEEYKDVKKASPLKAVLRASFTFFKNYVLQKGFLDGYEGLVISFYNAASVFCKYIKLYEKNKENVPKGI